MNKKELRALITIVGKVDPTLQAAMMKAAAESAKASNTMGKQWSSFGQKIKSGGASLLKGIGAGLLALTVAATMAFGAMAASGLAYASDLEEVQNVVKVTFGEGEAVIDSFAERAMAAYGLTTLEAKKYSSTIGSMLKSMQLGEEETLVMSQNLAALAGDLASFHNLSADEAFEKIRAGISGETEPLKQIGINMSVASMEAYALSQGISKAYSKMNQAEQAALRYNYLLSVTSDMQGDASRTGDSYARQLQQFKGRLQETSGEIMQSMLPALAAGMKEVNGFIAGMDTQAIGQFAGQLAQMAVEFLPLVMELMPTFGNLLMMLLPPLMEIGQALIPVVVQVVQALAQAFEPIMPVLMEFLRDMMPPLMSFLTAISPLIAALGGLFASVLAPALQLVVGLLTPLLDLLTMIAPILDAFVKDFTGFINDEGAGILQGALSFIAPGIKLPEFANGGITDRPAIFGEAGREAAIPIKPGNPRSLALLHRTAELLGVRNTYNADESERKISFTYAPVIHAQDDSGRLEAMLRRGYAEMRRMIEDFFADRGRLAWE